MKNQGRPGVVKNQAGRPGVRRVVDLILVTVELPAVDEDGREVEVCLLGAVEVLKRCVSCWVIISVGVKTVEVGVPDDSADVRLTVVLGNIVEDAVGECAVVDREETKPEVDDEAITVVADGEVELAATEGVIGSAVVLLINDTEVEETGN